MNHNHNSCCNIVHYYYYYHALILDHAADPGVPQDVFAIQVEHVMDSCIVTAFWRRPDNTAGNYEIKVYLPMEQTYQMLQFSVTQLMI